MPVAFVTRSLASDDDIFYLHYKDPKDGRLRLTKYQLSREGQQGASEACHDTLSADRAAVSTTAASVNVQGSPMSDVGKAVRGDEILLVARTG